MKNPQLTSCLMVKDRKLFPYNEKQDKDACFLSLLFNTVMEVLAGATRQEKEKTSSWNGRTKIICLKIS